MRKVLTSFGFGEHADLLQIAAPTFQKYAARHGYDFFVPRESFFDDATRGRPYSWWKIPLLEWLFERGYTEALWIDSDVVIRRHDKDIAWDCSDAPFHMVVHRANDGDVPNCGVWFVRREAEAFLGRVWNSTGSRRESGWWEQAALIDFLGGDSGAQKVFVPPGPAWGELPYEWNPHPRDERGVPPDCRFFHATQTHDRAVAMRRMIGEAT